MHKFKKSASYFTLTIFNFCIFASPAFPEATKSIVSASEYCKTELAKLPGRSNSEFLGKACANVSVMEGCGSVDGTPIFHFDQPGSDPTKGKRILTLALIHGDEMASGSVARSWMERLPSLGPRNTWRVIPIANPDGLKKKSRMNARGVDLNRNFPTDDWQVEAIERWEKSMRKDPRRYPGPGPASEIETQCYLKHLDQFKPDFIISIHTPLAVLDFDGPKMNFPAFKPLPWISLGNFPGSLGRYMWRDRGVPVLTIELKPGSGGVDKLEHFDRLQDISGTVAIQAGKILEKEKKNEKPKKATTSAEISKNDAK